MTRFIRYLLAARRAYVLAAPAALLALAAPARAQEWKLQPVAPITASANSAASMLSSWNLPRPGAPLASAQSDPMARYQVAQTLIGESPVLSQLRDWREMLRGRGALAQGGLQLWSAGGSKNDALGLRIGSRPLPLSALAALKTEAPGVELAWGKISVGSTAPLGMLNGAMSNVDQVLDKPGTASATGDSRLTWLAARPVESEGGNLQLVMARGRRDLTPGKTDDNKWAEGALWGARGDMALSPRWKLDGEWLAAKNDGGEKEAESAAAWRMAMAGPISHPFGEANFSARLSDVQNGFGSFAGGAPFAGAAAAGYRRGEIALQQGVALGRLSGGLSLSMGQSTLNDNESILAARSSVLAQSDVVESAANLNWKLTPSLSLTTTHKHAVTTDHTTTGEETVQNSAEQNTSNVGMEMKLSRSLAFSVAAGQTRAGRDVLRPDADEFAPLALRDEERLTAALQRRTGGGAWGIHLARVAVSATLPAETELQSQTVRFEAERKVTDWLRLKGALRLAGEDDMARQLSQDLADRSVEAQFSLSSLGRLALRFSDWEQRQEGLAGGATPRARREHGVSYNIGDGKAGMGLNIEYSRRAGNATPDGSQWRIGLTFK